MSLSVVTIGADELRGLIRSEVEAAIVAASRREASGVDRVSAADAARMVRKGRGLVLAACASGALPAKRDGKAWKIRAVDLDAWAAAGFKP